MLIGLWGLKKLILSEIILYFLFHTGLIAQEQVQNDTIRGSNNHDSVNEPGYHLKPRFTQKLEYSFTFSNAIFTNWSHENNTNQFFLQQNVKYLCQLGNERTFHFSNCLTHDLGFQYFFDSLMKVNLDENTLTTIIETQIGNRLSVVVSSVLATRILKGFDYCVNDSGQEMKILNSSFLTPLIGTFSAGFGIDWKNLGSITIGISSARLTYLKNTQIFKIRNVKEFYGVPEGKNHRFEYGISLRFIAAKEFLKRVSWDCDLLLFKDYHAPVDVTFKNLIGLKINKFLKTSIQTRILYEEKVNKKLQLENLISVGFYIHL